LYQNLGEFGPVGAGFRDIDDHDVPSSRQPETPRRRQSRSAPSFRLPQCLLPGKPGGDPAVINFPWRPGPGPV
jgi:hypothetical protein